MAKVKVESSCVPLTNNIIALLVLASLLTLGQYLNSNHLDKSAQTLNPLSSPIFL